MVAFVHLAACLAGRGKSVAGAAVSRFSMLSALDGPSFWQQAIGSQCNMQSRCFSNSAATSEVITNCNSTAPATGILEMRDYAINPQGFTNFLQLEGQYNSMRRSLYPYLGMFSADTGGNVSRIVHFYQYKDYGHRDAVRRAAAQQPEWQQYTHLARQYIQAKESTILMQAADLYKIINVPGAGAFAAPSSGMSDQQVVYELRDYQFRPGCMGVKELLKVFRTGLPAKVSVDKEGCLALLAHSDVGRLNRVIEVWRYPSAQILINACESTRDVPAWRAAKDTIYPLLQHLDITFMHPVFTSPWQ